MSPVSNVGAVPATEGVRTPRHDGEASRARLLHSGLQLFAQQGYAKTSTRELAERAGVNVASISYYFGDKAGLYRAVFFEPLGSPQDDIARYAGPGLSLAQALGGLYAGFLEPLKQGDTARLCMKLHFREMLEPTGLWAEQLDNNILPAHAALVEVLGRHLGVTTPDDDLHRLAFSIAGLAMQTFISRDLIVSVRPQLIATPQAIDLWAARLVDFAEAMVAVERARRQPSLPVKKNKP